MNLPTLSNLSCRAALLAVLFFACVVYGRDGVPTKPVFIYDYGWFEAHGYECWNVAAMWQDVPEKLKPHSWLILYVAPEQIYSSSGPNTGSKADIPPRPDPDYAQKDAALEKALTYADAQNIGVVLMVRRWCKSAAAAPSYERVTEACAKHPCVKGLLYTELGSHQFPRVDQEHLLRFTAIARQHKKKAFWAAFMSGELALWNFLMSEPQWRSFLADHRDTIVPTWKNVEPSDNMLNWADCVGLWLSGTSADWGFMFDSCYWPQYIGGMRRGQRARRSFWNDFYPKHSDWFTVGTVGCPSYLVKDTMILAALTGCRYFQFERFKPFEAGGTLRPVRDKTASLILDRKLCQDIEDVRSRVKLAIETPRQHNDLFTQGFSHTYSKQGPNLVWKEIFNIADHGLDLIPNEGKNYLVPVIPPDTNVRAQWRVIQAEEASQPGRLREALAELYPRRFVASDPSVLVFDAGDVVYLTDSREENRTTLEFTLESKTTKDYRCTILSEDATPCDVEVVTEELPGGWRKKFILFAGNSALLDARRP